MNPEEIVDVIAADETPFVNEQWGQGDSGNTCRYCGGDDWGGTVEHKGNCVWVAARKLRNRDTRDGKERIKKYT